MIDAHTSVPPPVNEPVLTYAPGTAERAELELTLARMQSEQVELTQTIGGRQELGGGRRIDVVQPHARRHVLGTMKNATAAEARAAVVAAKAAAASWRALPYDERAAVFLRAAELLSGPWRQTLNHARPVEDGLAGRDRRRV